MKIDGIGQIASQNNVLGVNEIKNIKNKEGFSDLLMHFIADVNQDLTKAKEAEKLLQSGKVENLIETMATIEKADISLRFATELRNKAIEAYQEIMRMQV
ncbi:MULTISPECIES: flagellar hook-basal body complex protein FliE [unclassified Nitratiruptor]|uniref:flagellar hook-basal body complex protein FliE n=1 Tax=unclassified Nitratiruptor TaxID=2624044 RepID=UPI0019165BAA|nr:MULTISPECIES: flagellar hook-basal body complex protein FliE [unclassified Nitratiruptor]BCD59923.1 flagellar hook-basal body complex protein FliE [Nitratiruptor sp. YY08-10]BCD63846.1 flagellar hook-basal body complex protein FliE [Nitratiruptor sp. YY08-14]